MENKEELEKKICEMKAKYPAECNIEGLEPALSHDIGIIIEHFRDLADKQGYMRGVEQALKCLPEPFGWEVKYIKRMDIEVDSAEQVGHDFCLSQAHDAITKLKEV